MRRKGKGERGKGRGILFPFILLCERLVLRSRSLPGSDPNYPPYPPSYPFTLYPLPFTPYPLPSFLPLYPLPLTPYPLPLTLYPPLRLRRINHPILTTWRSRHQRKRRHIIGNRTINDQLIPRSKPLNHI